MLRLLLRIGASLIALLAVPAVASAADSLALEAPSGALEETAVTIVARGDASPDRRLFLFTEPGTGGCAITPAEQQLRPASVEHTYRYVSPPSFLDVVNPTFDSPGPQQICAYLGAAPDEVPAVVASAVIAVRAPAVTLSLRQRGRTLRLVGRTEIPRRVFVYTAPPGRACAATAERQASRRGVRELLFRSVSGTFRQTLFLPPASGRRSRACVYAAEAQDAAPDARRSLPVQPG